MATYEEMVGLYGQEALDLAAYPGPLTRIITCTACDGDGRWQGTPHAWWGAQWVSCRHCEGLGEVEIKPEPRTLTDLNEEIMEESASAEGEIR